MNLNELIEMLEELRETEGGAEVKIAYQPNYPLCAYLAGVTYIDGTVYLAASEMDEYAPGAVYEEVSA